MIQNETRSMPKTGHGLVNDPTKRGDTINAEARVDVLLSTYNGTRFLSEQIHSVLHQTYPHFRLLIRDDGSSDDTPRLIAEFVNRYPGKVIPIDQRGPHLGACLSFNRLLEATNANYTMLCDQDDFWFTDKIAVSLQKIQECERRFSIETPILIHTDLIVTDATLRPLHGSLWSYQGLNPIQGHKLNRLLTQNVVTGCASLMNRALLRKALPIPPQAIIHDWWLALVASALGHLELVSRPTAFYRQHESNYVGASRYGFHQGLRRLRHLLQGTPENTGFLGTVEQASGFLERFSQQLPKERRQSVESFIQISTLGSAHKAIALLRHGYRKHGLLRNLGMFAEIVLN
jgi:glycosyltransferase involved in cell wall biosynthesis